MMKSSLKHLVEKESFFIVNWTTFLFSILCVVGYSSILDGTTKDGSKEHFEIALWLAEKFKMSLMGRAMDEELIQLEIATDGGKHLQTHVDLVA